MNMQRKFKYLYLNVRNSIEPPVGIEQYIEHNDESYFPTISTAFYLIRQLAHIRWLTQLSQSVQ